MIAKTRAELPGEYTCLQCGVIRNGWTPAEEARLRELYPITNTRELARSFGRSAKAIASRAKILHVAKAIGHGGKVPWTAAMDKQVRRLYPETLTRTLAATLGVSVLALHQRAEKLGIGKDAAYVEALNRKLGKALSLSGHGHRYPKGHVPANKGTRRPGYFAGRMRETQFKKGQEPLNAMPLWSFRWYRGGSTSGLGYLVLKTGKPGPKPIDGWEFVHKLIWEQAKGPLPDWHEARLWWKDGDHGNCSLSNLELVTSEEHMRRTTVHNLPAPLPELIQLAGALKRKIRNREEKLRGQEHVAGFAEPPVRDAGRSEGASRQTA